MSVQPLLCHEEVSRHGEAQPCDYPAVALRKDPEEGTAYPVCVRHTRHDMVPLRTVLNQYGRQGAGG